MSDQTVVEFVSKRIERFNALEKNVIAVVADMKELKYQVTQYDAKVQNFERQIMAKKTEILELDEQIRRKKIEVAGSFNNFRDDLSAREQALTKSQAELKVQQDQVKARAKAAEDLINKAEKVVGKQRPEPAFIPEIKAEVKAEVKVEEKRGPGRPKKEVAVNA